MRNSKDQPTRSDYVAGAMLSSGFVWGWFLLLNYFTNLSINLPLVLLADISYVLFIIGSVLSSYIVCNRAKSNHLIVGLKLAVTTWILTMIVLPSFVSQITIGFSIALLICLIAGNIFGSYLVLKSQLK